MENPEKQPAQLMCLLDPKQLGFIQYPELWVGQGWEQRHQTAIRDGNWDLPTSQSVYFSAIYEPPIADQSVGPGNMVPLEQYVFYTSLVQHFLHGVEWESTEWIRWVVAKGNIRRYMTPEQINSRIQFMDGLYDDLRQNGWRDDTEPPYINIGRNGRISIEDGRHRLCIAKIAGLKSVKVGISSIHPEALAAMEKIKEIRNNLSAPQVSPQAASPPTLNFPSRHKGREARDASILRLIGSGPLWVLDVGSNMGVTSNLLANTGHKVIGVESGKGEIDFARANSASQAAFFNLLIDADFFRTSPKFNVILFLSVLHRIYAYSGLARMLEILSAAGEKAGLLIVEGAIRHKRYTDQGQPPPEFLDLDVEDAIRWHKAVFAKALPNWTLDHIEHNVCSESEPYRVLFRLIPSHTTST